MNDYMFRRNQAFLKSNTGHCLLLMYTGLKRNLTEMAFDMQLVNVLLLSSHKVNLVRNYFNYLRNKHCIYLVQLCL